MLNVCPTAVGRVDRNAEEKWPFELGDIGGKQDEKEIISGQIRVKLTQDVQAAF